MLIELVTGSGLCTYVKKFVINGINADSNDFGTCYDHDPENAPDYGCGDMRFESGKVSTEVLEKYKITIEEFYEVCDQLDKKMSWGHCAYCS